MCLFCIIIICLLLLIGIGGSLHNAFLLLICADKQSKDHVSFVFH